MAVRVPSGLRAKPDGGLSIRSSAREETAVRRRKRTRSAMSLREYAQLAPVPGIGALDLSAGGDWTFQLEPFYGDEAADAPQTAIKKSTQVGASEAMWRQTARRVDLFAERAVYVFPTDTHVRDFGDERIEPAIEESPYFKSRILPRFVKHKTLKRIGNGFLYLRGANSVAAAQSVGAQMLVLDEYDELPPKMIAQYERRLSGAAQLGRMPRLRRLGVPRFPKGGIDRAYEASDQREWHVTCPDCGAEEPVRWAENVRWSMPGDDAVYRPGHDVDSDELRDAEVVERAWRACSQCEGSFEGRPIREGRWVATNPEGTYPGWWVHRVIVPRTDLLQLVRNSRKTSDVEVEAFFQNDLGIAYAASDAHLDEGSVKAACELGLPPESLAQTYMGGRPVSMGLDTAGERDFNYRISEQLPSEDPSVPNPRRALAIGTCRDFEEAADLMRRYNVQVCAVDAGPERRGAKALRSLMPGRVVLVEYEWQDGKSFDVTEVGERGTPLEGVPMKVRVNRTDAIDAMMDSIRHRLNRPLRVPPAGYIAHLTSLVRRVVIVKTKMGERPRRTYEKQGPDDYAHAEVYDLVATELLRLKHGVGMQAAASRPRIVAEDAVGFRRVRLEGGGVDDYRPGFGQD